MASREYGEHNKDVEVWQSSASFLEQVNLRTELTRRYWEQRNYSEATKYAESWHLYYEPLVMDKKDEEVTKIYEETAELINNAHELNIILNNTNKGGSEAIATKKSKINFQLYQVLKKIIRNNQRTHFALDLLFKKGIDPNRAILDG